MQSQNTLQQKATHCNTLQHTATHCNKRHRTATDGNAPPQTITQFNTWHPQSQCVVVHCGVLQCVAVHCGVLQCVSLWCSVLFVARAFTRCNPHQHTATHCNTLQHTATHCNTLLHTATHCNTLQHTATHCNTHMQIVQHIHKQKATYSCQNVLSTHCNTQQHCNTVQHSAMHHGATQCNILQHTATHCNTLQHTATYCNILQHKRNYALAKIFHQHSHEPSPLIIATRCNTLQHAAIVYRHCNSRQYHTATERRHTAPHSFDHWSVYLLSTSSVVQTAVAVYVYCCSVLQCLAVCCNLSCDVITRLMIGRSTYWAYPAWCRLLLQCMYIVAVCCSVFGLLIEHIQRASFCGAFCGAKACGAQPHKMPRKNAPHKK